MGFFKKKSDKVKTPQKQPMSAAARAGRIRDILIKRQLPMSKKEDAGTQLLNDSTLVVIWLAGEAMHVSGWDKRLLTWEQFAVMNGICACLGDALVQFAGLPKKAFPALVGRAVNVLFVGSDREKWMANEKHFSFATHQYRHMMEQSHLRPRVDAIGASFYKFLETDDNSLLTPIGQQLGHLMERPDVSPLVKSAPQRHEKG